MSEVTGSPEILDGRVKTLHPAIHGGLLARRSESDHMDQIAEHRITPVDIVVNNLYPFTETVGRDEATLEDALENIDIGGPAMTRAAAAKNFPDVIIVVDPLDYELVGTQITSGGVPFDERRRTGRESVPARRPLRHSHLHLSATERRVRSGHAGRTYIGMVVVGASPGTVRTRTRPAGCTRCPGESGGVANAKQLHGIEMSYLNYFDADSAWRIANGFPKHAVAIVKHANPVRPGGARATGRGLSPCVGLEIPYRPMAVSSGSTRL